jgi:hypothetical protein
MTTALNSVPRLAMVLLSRTMIHCRDPSRSNNGNYLRVKGYTMCFAHSVNGNATSVAQGDKASGNVRHSIDLISATSRSRRWTRMQQPHSPQPSDGVGTYLAYVAWTGLRRYGLRMRDQLPKSLFAWRHPEGIVESYRLAVKHSVLDNGDRRVRKLVRHPESTPVVDAGLERDFHVCCSSRWRVSAHTNGSRSIIESATSAISWWHRPPAPRLPERFARQRR